MPLGPPRWSIAIRELAIRGAPAIGVAAAYGLALAAARGEDLDAAERVLRRVASDRGQPRAGRSTEMRDDPTAEHARAAARRGGRALPRAWPRTRPSCSRPARAR